MIQPGEKYVLLTFDVESDLGSWTQEYRGVNEALPLILGLLQEKDVSATFLWEGMAALHNPSMLKKTHETGHEVGCHGLKHETLGDPIYFLPMDRAILPEEIPNRISKATRILEEITGSRPISFRAPRLWGSGTLIKTIEELRYLVDTTHAVKCKKDSLFPYHPSLEDFRKIGDARILEVPLAGIYGSMIREVSEKIKKSGIKITGSRSDKSLEEAKNISQWPILRLFGAEEFWLFLKPFINRQIEERGYSIVCIYQHPWEYIPMPSTLDCLEAKVKLKRFMYENCGKNTLRELAKLIDVFKDEGFTFLTLRDLLELWGNIK